MLRNLRSRRNTTNRSKFSHAGRSLRYETMEGRLVLSASGFAGLGNECAPELNDTTLDGIVPAAGQSFFPGAPITFSFSAADVVSDGGIGETAPEDILFVLDPDTGNRRTGATPDGATLNFNGTSSQWDFSWTPTQGQVQAEPYRLFLIATDDGGTNNTVPLSDAYAFEITISDTITAVDLNGEDDEGVDFGPVDFVEADNSTPVSIVDADASITVAGNGTLASATVQIVSPQAGEVLAVSGLDSSLVVDTSTPGRLVISVDGGGEADKSLFETALRSLTYNNTSDDPTATRTIQVTVNDDSGVTDGSNESAVATATVNITATNDQPVLAPQDGDLAPALIGQQYTLDLVAADPDGGDKLVFQIQNGPTGTFFIDSQPGSSGGTSIQVERDPSDGLFHAQINWFPAIGQVGDFLVSVTDTGLGDPTQILQDSEFYSVAIENQAPVAGDDPVPDSASFAIGEDAGGTDVGNLFDNDSDVDGDTFSLNSVLVSNTPVANAADFTTAKGALVTIGADGLVNYDPNGQFESLADGESETDVFTYTIIDSESHVSNEATVTITINGANDAPVRGTAEAPAFDINENAGPTLLPLSELSADVTDDDVNDSLAVVAAPAAPSEGGVFTLVNGELRFDPSGTDFMLDVNDDPVVIMFDVVLQDDLGEQVTVPAVIRVLGVDDTPVAVNDPEAANAADFTAGETSELLITSRANGLLPNDTDDGDNANLTVAEVNGSSAAVGSPITVTGTGNRDGLLTVDAQGTLSFNPQSNFNSLAAGEESTVTFNYAVTDGTNTSNTATVTLTITGENDAPAANNVTGDATEDGQPVTISFDGTDDDVTDTLAYDIVFDSLPSEGTVTNNDDGTFDFDPGDDFQDLAADATRNVSFNYTVSDGSATSSEATATVTVTGVDDGVAFNLDANDGLASVLPEGSQTRPDAVAVVLNLASPDLNVNSLNVDLGLYITDPDSGETPAFVIASDSVLGSTPFPAGNRPELSGSVLSWPTPVVGSGYVLRIAADGVTFDLQIDVVNTPLP